MNQSTLRMIASGRLRKIDEETGKIFDAVMEEVLAGNVVTVLLMIRDLSEGKMPPEVEGKLRLDTSLSNSELLKILETIESVSDQEQIAITRRLMPILREQVGIPEVVQ